MSRGPRSRFWERGRPAKRGRTIALAVLLGASAIVGSALATAGATAGATSDAASVETPDAPATLTEDETTHDWDQPLTLAASASHAWLVTSSELHDVLLYHVPLGDVQGEALAANSVTPLEASPIRLLAAADRLSMIFPPPAEPDDVDDGDEVERDSGGDDAADPTNSGEATPTDARSSEGDLLRLRSTRAIAYRPSLFGYQPLQPLPPLRVPEAALESALLNDRHAVALTAEGVWVLAEMEWRSVGFPAGLDPQDGLDRIFLVAARPGEGVADLVAKGDDGSLRVFHLRRAKQAEGAGARTTGGTDAASDSEAGPEDANESVGDDIEKGSAGEGQTTVGGGEFVWNGPTAARWRDATTDEVDAVRFEIVRAGEALLIAEWLEPAESAESAHPLRLSLARSEGVVRRGVYDTVPRSASIAAVGDAVLFVWGVGSDEPSDGVTAIAKAQLIGADGATRFVGPVVLERTIATNQVHVVLLLLFSISATVVLYVMRRDADTRHAVDLPERTSLADPGRRLLAGVVDASVALGVVSILWGEPVRWWTDDLLGILSEEGAAPVLMWAFVLGLHMTLGEIAFAGTIGKVLLRLRTTDRRGHKPPPTTAAARSFAKAICPFSAFFLILEPARPHPSSFTTYVVVKAPDDADDESGGGDGDDSPGLGGSDIVTSGDETAAPAASPTGDEGERADERPPPPASG